MSVHLKRWLAASASMALMAVATPVSAEPWFPSAEYDPQKSTFIVSESYQLGDGSVIVREDYDPKTGGATLSFCPSISGYCSEKISANGEGYTSKKFKAVIAADLVMGVCTTKAQDFCIEEVRVYSQSENPLSAELLGEVDTKKTAPYKRRNLPAGGAASNWKSQSTDPALSELTVSAYVWAKFVNGKKGFTITDMNAVITPYLETSGDYLKVGLAPSDYSKSKWGANPVSEECAWVEEGRCGRIIDSPENVVYGLTFRIGKESVNFFNGRLTDPTLTVKKLAGNKRLVSIDASPVSVNGFAVTVPTKSKLARVLSQIPEKSGLSPQPGSHFVHSFYFDFISDWFDLAAGQLKDTSPGQRTWWRLSSQKLLGSCWAKSGEISGLVTTNATAYSDGAPQFNKGFLDYQVAGLHFNSDETEAQGTYDLTLRSDVARCLYGFSKAPVYGTVSVSGDGDKNIATTVVKEKGGWLTIAAKGFTFSKKTIKVKLTQKRK